MTRVDRGYLGLLLLLIAALIIPRALASPRPRPRRARDDFRATAPQDATSRLAPESPPALLETEEVACTGDEEDDEGQRLAPTPAQGPSASISAWPAPAPSRPPAPHPSRSRPLRC